MRSLLLVSGDDEKKLDAALASGADALIVDVEPLAGAGAPVAPFLAAARARAPRLGLYLRIHALDSGLADADLDAAMAGAPDGIVLPKCREGADVQRLGAKLAVHEARHGLADGGVRIIAAVETAQGLLALASYRGASRRLAGLLWSAGALAADLGAAAGGHSAPCALARNLTLIGAAAAAVMPIDGAFSDVGNLARLRAEAEAARRDGFVAKIALDPAQVEIINAAFAAPA